MRKFKGLKPPYDVAVIDPAWNFDTWSGAGAAKSPQAQYETMSLAEICALPVRSLLRPDGVLILWTTWPALARGDAHAALAAWGMAGSSGGAWAKRTRAGKLRIGTGYVWRGVCEPIIIAAPVANGRRGVKLRGSRWLNLVETFSEFTVDGLAREHSRKPDEFYDMLTSLTPGARRADVFARQSRPGWDTWGRERAKFDR